MRTMNSATSTSEPADAVTKIARQTVTRYPGRASAGIRKNRIAIRNRCRTSPEPGALCDLIQLTVSNPAHSSQNQNTRGTPPDSRNRAAAVMRATNATTSRLSARAIDRGTAHKAAPSANASILPSLQAHWQTVRISTIPAVRPRARGEHACRFGRELDSPVSPLWYGSAPPLQVSSVNFLRYWE